MNNMDTNFSKTWAKDTLGPFGQFADTVTPFKFCIIPEFIKDQETVSKLRDDINSRIRLRKKDNDLYRFKQSKDLKSEVAAKKLTPVIHEFIDIMTGHVRQYLEKIFQLDLLDKNFDITASRYDTGDYLLCHNDDIKHSHLDHKRGLAFVYYLNSKSWSQEDGGALAIYDSNLDGEPVAINNRIYPQPNTLVVFATSSTSWHAVEEVYCKGDPRLSINGWFHITSPRSNLDDSIRIVEPCPYIYHRPIVLDDRIETFFKECVNPQYLMEKTCFMVRKKFKRESEINLTNFLVKEKFQEICQALEQTTRNEANLTHVGPYNKRNYRTLKLDSLPQICRDLFDAFRSELFFMLLARLTGLDLQPPSLEEPGKDDDVNHGDSGSSEESESESDEDDLEDEEDSDDNSDEDDGDEDEDDEGDDDDDDEDGGDAAKEASKRPRIDNPDESGTSKSGTILNALKDKQFEDAKSSKKKRKRNADPFARLEFRHLETGSYTLIHDHGYELGEKSALDVILHFNHDFKVNLEDGGYISYIDAAPEDDPHDMDCELLKVEPKSNCLSMVYRCDEGTCRFLKQITKSHKSNYQDLYCVFFERPEDLPRKEDISAKATVLEEPSS